MNLIDRKRDYDWSAELQKHRPPQKKRNPGYLHEYQTLKDISLRHWLAMTCLENTMCYLLIYLQR